MIAELLRFRSDAVGTFGVLLLPGKGTMCTVEPPWVPYDSSGKVWPYGVDKMSCVPLGLYNLALHYSPKFKRDMWYILGDGVVLREDKANPEEWRSGAMFHVANEPRELQGCIAPGEFYQPLGSKVVNSALALKRLTTWLHTQRNPRLHIRAVA